MNKTFKRIGTLLIAGVLLMATPTSALAAEVRPECVEFNYAEEAVTRNTPADVIIPAGGSVSCYITLDPYINVTKTLYVGTTPDRPVSCKVRITIFNPDGSQLDSWEQNGEADTFRSYPKPQTGRYIVVASTDAPCEVYLSTTWSAS